MFINSSAWDTGKRLRPDFFTDCQFCHPVAMCFVEFLTGTGFLRPGNNCMVRMLSSEAEIMTDQVTWPVPLWICHNYFHLKWIHVLSSSFSQKKYKKQWSFGGLLIVFKTQENWPEFHQPDLSTLQEIYLPFIKFYKKVLDESLINFKN